MKRIFFILLLILKNPLSVVYGEEPNFFSDVSVHYAVAAHGVTTVTYDITLTNGTSLAYPKEYRLILDNQNITDVVAHDRKGTIIPAVAWANGITDILVTLHDKSAGLGKKVAFTIRYQTPDIVIKRGAIWELRIPGIRDELGLKEYRVSLDVPFEFGPLAYISPPPAGGRTWVKEQLIHGGISAAFGIEELYKLILTYRLINTTAVRNSQTITLPPDTAYQKITIDTIEPLPLRISRDRDGNWIGHYDLAAHESQKVTANLYVSVSTNPRDSFAKISGPFTEYMKADTYWPVNDTRIGDIAKDVGSIEGLYRYVVNTLSYDYTRIRKDQKRRDAIEILKNPYASLASDFSDLFITLARATGVPARQVVGYALSDNLSLQPVAYEGVQLHTWPEYFDTSRSVWVPVDPTWENTSGGIDYYNRLDYRHIVLAIRGHSSSTPLPAGLPAENSGEKKVIVTYAQSVPGPTGQLFSRITFPIFIFSGLPMNGNVYIENSTRTNIDEVPIAIESQELALSFSSLERNITPYSQRVVPFSFVVGDWFALGAGNLRVTVNNEVTLKSFWLIPAYPICLAIVISLIGIKFVTNRIRKKKALWKKSKKS